MIGILEDKLNQTTLDFKNEGDLIYLVGESKNDISSSEYLYSYHKINNTPAPFFDLETEHLIQASITKLIKLKLINSAHDVSDGGLFINLLESSMVNNLGFEINSDVSIRKDAFLFGESQSRVVVSISEHQLNSFEAELKKQGAKYSKLGQVKGKNIVIDGENFGTIIEFKEGFETSLEKYLN